jgi:hypothetical protein
MMPSLEGIFVLIRWFLGYNLQVELKKSCQIRELRLSAAAWMVMEICEEICLPFLAS